MYQVLARKYRPRNFNELVGQNHVSRALTSALDRGRLHHAYLFTGTRGVGKTTIARILAKCLNCETGITSTPCEVCPTCRAVNEGRFIDLIEIDAASRTKVEDTRELLDNVPYAPTQGRFKVYLIDEVHMLSTHSFNALLKTLEEPPEHVKFLFATTDPQKLPITVISRCLQFTLRPLAVDEITHHLTDILAKEQIHADQDAIWQIAESAQGSLRDALSLTDQAIAYGQGEIHHQDVKEMLGLIDRTIIYDLILSIHQNHQQRVSELLIQFRQQALDVSLVLDQLISTLHEVALLQHLPDLSLKYSAEINQKIIQLARNISAQDLQLYYQIACKGRADLQLAVTQEQGFEMCILRLLAFRPLQYNEIVVAESVVVNTSSSTLQDDETIEQSSARVEQNIVEKPIEIAVQTEQSISKAQREETRLIENNIQSEQIVFEPSSDDALFGFDDDLDENHSTDVSVNEVSSDDFLLEEIAPLPEDNALQNIIVEKDHQLMSSKHNLSVVQEKSVADIDISVENTAVLESVEINSSEEIENSPYVSVDTSSVLQGSASKKMPREILALSEQILEGEWTVEKWEYWFRNSDLSPAVQELAQHGIMSGQIGAETIFHIPKRYEQLLNQLQYLLEQALKAQWPSTHYHVQYSEVDSEGTPFALQNIRKEKAYARATELLHEEPTVSALLHTFDGEVQNIQLK